MQAHDALNNSDNLLDYVNRDGDATHDGYTVEQDWNDGTTVISFPDDSAIVFRGPEVWARP